MRFMVKRGFVKKQFVTENDRLKYVYHAVSPLRVLDLIKTLSLDAEKLRKMYKQRILKGTKESIAFKKK
jgi:predicted DNA-binding transcriptional regulator